MHVPSFAVIVLARVGGGVLSLTVIVVAEAGGARVVVANGHFESVISLTMIAG